MPSATVSPWTAFHIEKLKQEKLENEITAVALSCQKGCEKSHVTRCPTCYRHILSLYRERYVTDYDSREWFAGRTEFIAEIANMLAAAEVGKSGIDLLSIEARINAEKRIWQQFAQYQRDPEFSVEIEKQRALLESKTDEELDEMACRLARTGTEDQAKEYENIFFAQFSNEQKSKYIAMLAQGKTMDEVCDAIKENSARYKNQKVVYDKEKRELEAKLEQLRRAKNANEQQKRKKKEAVSQKEKAQSLNLPSCSACGTKSDLAGYFECTLCWVLAEAGAISRSTVYCGEKCSAKHQVSSIPIMNTAKSNGSQFSHSTGYSQQRKAQVFGWFKMRIFA